MPIIRVEMGSLKEIENDLGQMKDKSKMALKAAINEVAKDLNKKLMSGTRDRYIMSKDSKLSSANKVESAKVGNLTATITVKSGIGELYKYSVRPRGYTPGGPGRGTSISGQVRRDSGAKTLALGGSGSDQHKAFVVQYKSGHITVAQRVPGKKMRGKNKEAIKTLQSNSITKSEEMVYRESLEGKVDDMMADAIHRQVERYLPVTAS